jgi:arginyl-tRNA--protein-N-Asp/Glu arginylyltransferase
VAGLVITERFEPETLTRAELDALLARGFYRIGCSIITADYLVSDGDLRSTIWTRLDLAGYRFKRSLRKLMARNAQRFRVEVGELVLDEAHEDLYARYVANVGGHRAKSLDAVLGGDAGRALFHTREISIWSGSELVAFSWFDLGETSVQSLIGVYDPAHAKYGLGFWTMLLEVAHAADIGMRYHYSGYILGEPSGMDYKRRVGALEHLHPSTKEWRAESPYAEGASPAEVQRRRIGEAELAHVRAGTPVTREYNSVLMIPGLHDLVPGCAMVPILLVCATPGHPSGILTTWDESRSCFTLHGGKPISVSLAREDESDPSNEPVEVHLFVTAEPLGDFSTAEEAADAAPRFLSILQNVLSWNVRSGSQEQP